MNHKGLLPLRYIRKHIRHFCSLNFITDFEYILLSKLESRAVRVLNVSLLSPARNLNRKTKPKNQCRSRLSYECSSRAPPALLTICPLGILKRHLKTTPSRINVPPVSTLDCDCLVRSVTMIGLLKTPSIGLSIASSDPEHSILPPLLSSVRPVTISVRLVFGFGKAIAKSCIASET